MSISITDDVRKNLVKVLKALKTPAGKIRTVSTKFRTTEEVRDSELPYLQVIVGKTRREKVPQVLASNCFQPFDVWLYCADEDDVEFFIELIRVAVYQDRTRDVDGVLNTEVTDIGRDDIGWARPRGLAIITVEVKFRESDT